MAEVGKNKRVVWQAAAMMITTALFLSTLQAVVNGSDSPYATDVGEIQNALPRWGTIHWTGYPVYTGLGSLFVTVLYHVGILPAAGTSLFSALWGVVSIGLLVALLQELGVDGPLAALSAIVAGAATSVWMDASIAEVHTFTMALTIGTLLCALRVRHSGLRRDVLLLALCFSQGVAHQRAVALLAPAVIVLVFNRWPVIWRNLLPAVALCLLAPLSYLYLPWRVRQGATWTFGTPGTWEGTLRMLLDNRAARVVAWPEGMAEWARSIWRALSVTAVDLPVGLIALGLLGLFTPALKKRWQVSLGLTLSWVPHMLLTAAIWIGRIGDAQLAAHLPVTLLAAVGLGLLGEVFARRSKEARVIAILLLVGMVIYLGVVNRPTVLEVTKDPGAEAVIAVAEQVAPPPAGRPTTLMVLWGHDYWALVYAQAYEGRLPGLDLVDHNAPFEAILARGNRLLTPSKTLHYTGIAWWEQRLGPIHLSSAAPDVVEIRQSPRVSEDDIPPGPTLDLGNGILIRSAQLAARVDGSLGVTIYWQAESTPARDYSVAVHLVAHDPPRTAEDVLAQADQAHPVYGWYPTSRWHPGEIVRDQYRISLPRGAQPRAVRIGMYYVDEDGSFNNSRWLSIVVTDVSVE